jgi:hypothetical protein
MSCSRGTDSPLPGLATRPPARAIGPGAFFSSHAGACYLAAAIGLGGAVVLSLVRPAFRFAPEAPASATRDS